MFAAVFSGFRDLASASPWPTGIAFLVMSVYFAVKFTDMPKRLKAKIWFDKPKLTPCSNCAPFTAETYCVECKKVFCKFCTCLLHHPGMKTEKHSIEALVETEKGVQILSHLLPNFLTFTIIGVFMYVITRPSDEQILGASYCPVIQRTRQGLVRWDPSIFYYWKASFAQFCDFEDSAWRLYIDAWFRAVVTRTDSIFLVLAAFVKAFLFEKYIEFVLAKLMGMFYAGLAIVVRQFERHIPERFHWMEDIAKTISFAKLFKAAGKPPPPTFWRVRPMQNWLEGWKYALDRRSRVFSFYSCHAQAIQVALLRASLYGAVALRLACILFGADIPLRSMFSAVGMGPMMQREQKMFLGLSGIVTEPQKHEPYFSEWMFTMGFTHVISQRWISVTSSLEVVASIFEGLRAAFWPMARVLFIPGLIFLVVRTYWTKTINKQNAYFARNWPTVRQEIFGSCSRDSLVDWKNAHFRRKLAVAYNMPE